MIGGWHGVDFNPRWLAPWMDNNQTNLNNSLHANIVGKKDSPKTHSLMECCARSNTLP
jgi:hypothetical protein